jgi:hypothetical protein
MAQSIYTGTVVACRLGRPQSDGSESKYVDIKLLVGESVVRFWGFADKILESCGGDLPGIGVEISVRSYSEIKPANEKGPAYESHKAAAVGPPLTFAPFVTAETRLAAV